MGSSELMRILPIVLLWWIALSVTAGEQTMSDCGAPAGRRTLEPPDARPLDPEQRLRDARAEYEARRRLRSHAIEPWTSIGPDNYGGRVNALALHPTKIGTLYAGAAGGGVWLTEDGGGSWRPLTDDIPNLTVGAMALAPSAPNVLYVGSGEPFGSSAGPSGIGVIKSTDGGATWQFPSSVIADSFFRLSVHAQNPDSVLAASPRGLHLTVDGGKTWNLVLSECEGNCWPALTDIVRDPSSPDVVLAAWPGGAAKIMKSTDGGATWSPSAAGLPGGYYGRIALTAVPGKPGAFLAAADLDYRPRIFSTLDVGISWTETPTTPENYLFGQGWYDNAITASPADGAIIGGGVSSVRSGDGGRTWNQALINSHPDVHDFAWQGTTLYIANDGGVYRSDDNGARAVARTKGLVTTQYYTIAHSALRPERVLAGTQDNGALVRDAAGQEWAYVGGGDVLGCLIDPAFPDTMSIASQFGTIQRFDHRQVMLFPGEGSVSIESSSIEPPIDLREPQYFDTSLVANANDPRLLFTSTYRVWRSSDAGTTWEPLSTRTNSGPPWTADDFVSAIASAPTDPAFLYAHVSPHGLYRSRDGGETWSLVVDAALVFDIVIDSENPVIAYAAVIDRIGNKSLIATMDGGHTWHVRTSGLPPNYHARAIAIHPRDPQTLYCGTDVGLFRSRDRGLSWARIPEIPAVDVRAIAILPDGTVRVGTHGRGVWELRATSNNKGPVVEVFSLPETVAVGTTLFVTGRVTDPDGDATMATWHWSDGGQSVPYDKRRVGHLFARAGLVEVTLLAKDSKGAIRAATRTVRVIDAADSCATPGVIPSEGPFPFSIRSNLASATSTAGDPITSCQGSAGRSLWYAFTPAVSGTYVITTSSERRFPLVGVWTGDECGPFTPVTCYLGISGEVNVEFQAVAGTTYRIELLPLDYTLSGGPVTLTVERQHEEGPAVEVVSTAWLATDRNTRIVINGERFTSDAVVRIDGVEVESNMLTERVIIAFAKPHSAGPVDLEVITSAGRGVLRNALRYAPDPIQPPGKHRAARH